MSIVDRFDLELYQMNAKKTLLNGNLNKDVYIVPTSFEVVMKENMIYKLHKSIYVLKQASR